MRRKIKNTARRQNLLNTGRHSDIRGFSHFISPYKDLSRTIYVRSLLKASTSGIRESSSTVFYFASEPYSYSICYFQSKVSVDKIINDINVYFILNYPFFTGNFSTSCAIAHMNPANSLATAVIAVLLDLPRDNNRKYFLCSLCWAFQEIA